ncbi:MAG: hypothetical protein ACOZE5_08930 [Verrucomicrobiota bacterium]
MRELLVVHAPLVEKCRHQPPDMIECSALATMLHSFYTGIENLLSRVAREIDGETVKSDRWHRDLLQRMTEARKERSAVISARLRVHLQDYLGFRHFFRNAYSFHFDWEEMAPLVLECENILQQFSREVAEFLSHEPSGETSPDKPAGV